jgi:ligand-binding sensor domain-containing protein
MRLLSLFLLLLLWCTESSSQVADFISYGVEDGLSQSEVQCIYQDSRGYMWIGTTGGGVCSFDGVSFREFGKKNGLVGQIVNCISEDSLGRMWFGTTTGLSLYDGKSFTNFGTPDIGFSEVSSVLPMKDGILVSGGGGITKIFNDGKTIKRIYTKRRMRSLCMDEAGDLWGASGSTLFRFRGYSSDTFDLHLPAGYQGMIYSVCSDKHGYLYLGLSDRMLVYHPSTATVSENDFTKLFAGQTVHYVYRDSRGNMWGTTTSNRVDS